MNTKKVFIATKCSIEKKEMADNWVELRKPKEPIKRLTIDIPLSLHIALKTSCAKHGVKITDAVRELLINKYGKKED